MTITERFDKYWQPIKSGCWIWIGARHRQGYGQFQLEGKNRLAHRVSWWLAYGFAPPPTIKVCHKCDVPACVNPAHLFLGSQGDNTRDCVAKGRARRSRQIGSLNGCAIFSENQVRSILRDKRKLKEIAAEYECAVSTISMIQNGHNWSHLFMEWQSENANKRAEMRL